ncbi:hypothetical protein AAKU61_004307 [Undibacterium sp. GrIS 1.2]
MRNLTPKTSTDRSDLGQGEGEGDAARCLKNTYLMARRAYGEVRGRNAKATKMRGNGRLSGRLSYLELGRPTPLSLIASRYRRFVSTIIGGKLLKICSSVALGCTRRNSSTASSIFILFPASA